VPGVILALAPSSESVRPGLLRRVLSFAIPAGIITGTAAFILYDTLLGRSGNTVDEARTGATSTLLGISLVVLVLASRPLAVWKVGLAFGMLASYVLVVAIDPLRRFFRIDLPDDAGSRVLILAAIVIGGVLVVVAKLVVDRIEARRVAAGASAVADDTPIDPA
jgi:cation-transporting ATPase E